MDYIILDNQLEADDFIRLFASAGWGELPLDMVQTSLANSYATFSVKSANKVIAMARLLGDGAMSFFSERFSGRTGVSGKRYRSCKQCPTIRCLWSGQKRHKNGMFFLGGDTNGFNENRKIHSGT